jgi:hypothetical protein
LSSHLIEIAFNHDKKNKKVLNARLKIYEKRKLNEKSTMSIGIFNNVCLETKDMLSKL